MRTHESYALGAEPGEVYTGLFEGRESSGVVVRSSELFFEGNDGAGVDDCLNAFTIDVGWGDAHLISFPGGRTVLIDCGSSRHIDYLRRFLDDNPTNSGGVIDALVLTHPHEDHIGGALGDLDSAGDGLLEACFVRRILIPDIRPVDYPLLDEIARYADRQGIPVYRLKAGDSEATRPDVLDWDPAVNVQVLNSGSAAGEENINNVSLVLKLTYGEIDILLTGDAEEEVENHLLSLYAGTGVLSCEILKLSHHGSDDANSPSFLKAVSPRVAILSVDSGEVGWSLPDPSVINNLECLLTDLFRTDKRWTEGPFLKSNIRVSTDGTVFEVRYIDP